MTQQQFTLPGQIVSWEVPRTVSIQRLRVGLAEAGLDPDLAGDMAPRNALRRAFREMKEGRVIRELRREGDDLVFQFTAEHLTDQEATYDKEAELVLNVVTGVVTSTVQALATQAWTLLNEHINKRGTADLTRLVQKVFLTQKADLIPIRPQGGCYFVPHFHSALVDQVDKLLTSIGGYIRPWAIEFGAGKTSKSVADTVAEYIAGLIRDYRESLAIITKATREGVIDSRLEEARLIRQRMATYAGILGIHSQNLLTEMEQAQQEFEQAQLREPEAKPEKVAVKVEQPVAVEPLGDVPDQGTEKFETPQFAEAGW